MEPNSMVDKQDIAFFTAGFIGGPVLLNINPAVTSFFYWMGVVSATLFGACGLGLALGLWTMDKEGLK